MHRGVAATSSGSLATTFEKLWRSSRCRPPLEDIRTGKLDDPERQWPLAPTSSPQVDPPKVAVENWKTAEDGRGTIFRLVEEGGKSANVHLTFPLFILQEAWRANAVEENPEELPVSAHSLEVNIWPHEILTLRVAATFATDPTR